MQALGMPRARARYHLPGGLQPRRGADLRFLQLAESRVEFTAAEVEMGAIAATSPTERERKAGTLYSRPHGMSTGTREIEDAVSASMTGGDTIFREALAIGFAG